MSTTKHPVLSLLELIPKLLNKELPFDVHPCEETDAACKFYSKPFKPESIPLLFEEWERTVNGQNTEWHSNGNSSIRFVRPDTGNWREIRIWAPENIIKAPVPSTLADFITDAKRAGLSLYWRKEVVEEYPFLIVGA